MAGTPGRILAIDYGLRRVGLALSDPLRLTAQPLATITRDSDDDAPLVAQIAGLCREHEVVRIVVGLPLNMDGSEGPMAARVRDFAAALREAVDVDVVLWDERLSTAAAERALLEGDVGRRRRKGMIDRVAAVLILQNYLNHVHD